MALYHLLCVSAWAPQQEFVLKISSTTQNGLNTFLKNLRSKFFNENNRCNLLTSQQHFNSCISDIYLSCRGIMSRMEHVVLNGDAEKRYPGNLNFSFAYVEGESLLMALKNIAVSSGSACTSASLEPSYVLRAIGADDEMAHSSIRFGIGRFTTEQEIDFTIDLLEKHVARLREMSPLWEMVQEGVDLKSINWSQDASSHH